MSLRGMIRRASARSSTCSCLRADLAKLMAYSATAPSPGRGLEQSLHRGEGFTRLGSTLLGDVGVVEIFPQGAVLLEINQHGLPSPARIDQERDSGNVLVCLVAHQHGV